MISARIVVASALLIGTTTIVLSARMVTQRSANWRTRFNEAALQVPFDSEREPVADSGVAPGAYPIDAPRMTIALARTRDTGRVARLESRITSQGAYPALGIAPGVNYVWSEFVKDTLRQLVIPADTAYPVHWLAFVPHSHASPGKVARLVVVPLALVRRLPPPDAGPQAMSYALGKCTPECPFPQPWCIAGDTTNRLFRASPASSELARYFGRNKIPWVVR